MNKEKISPYCHKLMTDIFIMSVNGLASQGFKKSMSNSDPDNLECAYHPGDNIHCAIGWCDPDQDLINLEGHSASYVIDYISWIKNRLVNTPFSDSSALRVFVDLLQEAHDDSEDIDDMKSFLRELAAFYNLPITMKLLPNI